MVCIVNPKQYPTKKALREAIQRGESVAIEDPSFMAPRSFFTSDMIIGQDEIVTNHPKRTYFAKIRKQVDGTLKVV